MPVRKAQLRNSLTIQVKKTMNRNDYSFSDTVPVERLRMLERRIEELESRIAKEKDLFLEEDLKARGLK